MTNICIVILLCTQLSVAAQVISGENVYVDFWNTMDQNFANLEDSPLPKDEISGFDSIPRYAYNPKFRIHAEWLPLDRQKPFNMKTSTERLSKYQKIGVLRFTFGDTLIILPAYQSLDELRSVDSKSHVFVPFTDMSNGKTTYMGGRYLDLTPIMGDSITLDFNLSYNPYCAYSDRYSCPVPPKENYIDHFIAAGARSSH